MTPNPTVGAARCPVFVVANHPAGHEAVCRGIKQDRQEQVAADMAVYRQSIIDAMIDADQLETHMRAKVGDLYFSPHTQCALPSVAAVKRMCEDIEEAIDALYRDGKLKNAGWGVTAVYGGHASEVSIDERSLSAKTGDGSWKHPFMLARDNNDGQATNKSKRVLLMCKIGDRALTNPCITHFVDCTDDASFAMKLQREFGRSSRWFSSRAGWLFDDSLRQFATARICVPATLLTPEKRQSLIDAKDFIDNMVERVAGVGFRTWTHVLRGEVAAGQMANIDPSVPPLKQYERYKIQAAVAAAEPPLDPAAAAAAAASLFPDFSPKRLEKAADYGAKLVASQTFRQGEILASDLSTMEPVSVVERLKPQEPGTHSVDDLISFARNYPAYREMANEYVERLKAGNDKALNYALSVTLSEIQSVSHRPPARAGRKLQGNKQEPGVLRDVYRELYYALQQAGQNPNKGSVFEAINASAKRLFGTEDAKDGGPMDRPAYHVAIEVSHRDTIKRIAYAMLVKNGELGPALLQFAEG